jgi:hypothetical protein
MVLTDTLGIAASCPLDGFPHCLGAGLRLGVGLQEPLFEGGSALLVLVVAVHQV